MTGLRTPRRPALPVATAALTAGALLAGYGIIRLLQPPHPTPPARPAAATSTQAVVDPLATDIVRLQARVRANPSDYADLAVLGLEYVQQAKITVDPAYYPRARGVLSESLALNSTDNYQAMAGEAAYHAALHDFATARSWAQRGLRIDPYSTALYGSLADADTQLGDYSDAETATQKMLDLDPGVPALTRAEYVYELRGQVDRARAMLARALSAASSPSDIAFVHQIDSDLAFNNGNPQLALRQARAGLAADPAYTPLLEEQAKAEAALAMTTAAVRDYTHLVSALAQPQYLVEFGEYLDSLGRHQQAADQYDLFEVEGRLFTANGVTLDTDPTLFYADHTDPVRALRYGTAGIANRPFLEMQDAYSWALHVNGRDTEALRFAQRAQALGTRNALFAFHLGMIERALGHRTAALAALQRALLINPYFSPREAPAARAAIEQLLSPR